MVETDVGDDAQIGRNQVGAIQPTSQSYLNNRHIHMAVCKIAECHGCGQLEERGMKRFEERTLTLHEINHILLTHRLTIHPDALTEIYQMR